MLADTTLLSVFVQLSSVVQVWMIAKAIHTPIPLAYQCIMVPMVSLLTLLPISVSGSGAG